MSAILDDVPAWVRSLRPYEPGMPIEELERRHGIRNSVKLASNENPVGPSPRALAAIEAALPSLHRYPEGDAPALRARLADRHGVSERHVLLGNGSNEVIELVVRAFIAPGDHAVMADQAFVIYALVVQAAGGTSTKVPLRDFTHDLAAMGRAVTDRTKVVFVANPNNPTGTIVRQDAWRHLLDTLRGRRLVVVADEAYAEYVTDPEWPDTIGTRRPADPPVITLRTFSKLYGLAGLRIGYGVADPDVIDVLGRLRQPFSVNSLAQVAALAALDDDEHVQRTLAANRGGRAYLERELGRLGVPYVPSHANFLLVQTGAGASVYQRLLRHGVITRPMDTYGLPEHVRVTIGLPEENERFIGALAAVLAEERA